jgi:hypothetical protein
MPLDQQKSLFSLHFGKLRPPVRTLISKRTWLLLFAAAAVSCAASTVTLTPAQASEFVVCEGEFYADPPDDGCPRDQAATQCGTIDNYAASVCQQTDGTDKFIKVKLADRGGNQCGYATWRVICQ